MTEKEVGELYIRLAFQYESAIGRLLDKKIIEAPPMISLQGPSQTTWHPAS